MTKVRCLDCSVAKSDVYMEYTETINVDVEIYTCPSCKKRVSVKSDGGGVFHTPAYRYDPC